MNNEGCDAAREALITALAPIYKLWTNEELISEWDAAMLFDCGAYPASDSEEDRKQYLVDMLRCGATLIAIEREQERREKLVKGDL